MRALVIEASSRQNSSVTRNMTQQFRQQFAQVYPDGQLQERDLIKTQVPHLSADTIEGFFALSPSLQAKRATVLSDRLITEFMAADLLCFGVPMYNFNVPSALKAYMDQIIRVGHTFTKVTDGELQGLCAGKRALVCVSMGGMFAGSEMDLVQPWFKAIANFLNLDGIDFVCVEGTSRGNFSRSQAMDLTADQIHAFLSAAQTDVPTQLLSV